MEKKGVAFNGTKEQEKKLRAVIEQHKGQAGAAIPVLHEALIFTVSLPCMQDSHSIPREIITLQYVSVQLATLRAPETLLTKHRKF